VKAIALQMDISWENKPANYARVRALLAKAAPEPGSLVALPEMFATGFSMNAATLAEAHGGETEQFLGALAKELKIMIVGGAAIRGDDGKARNVALGFSPAGERICSYAKMRPFTLGQEDQHYAAGDRPTAFQWGECTVSPFICYDVRFPELFRDVARYHQPQLFVVIANFPEKRITHWVRLLRARAIENQAYVLGVNRVGDDPYYHYNGRSILIDPQGDLLADAGETEGVIQAPLDLDQLAKYRAGLPFLKDLR
jgi:predicted amidohydrolase